MDFDDAFDLLGYMLIAVCLCVLVWLPVDHLILHRGSGANPAPPAALVRTVNVNGHNVNCITIDHSTSCDFLGWTSQPPATH